MAHRSCEKLARRFTRVIRGQEGLDYLVAVADDCSTETCWRKRSWPCCCWSPAWATAWRGTFGLFDEWLDRVGNWAEDDTLVQSLIGPLIVADPRRLRRVFVWSRSQNRWRRRAAAVALLRGTNQGLFWDEVQRMTHALLDDEDDMVRKGLAWLLREAARYDAKRTLPLLMEIREQAPRAVLRTACERLTPAQKKKVLAR